MKDIEAIKGRHYIASLIDEGEHEQQDFKFKISDARKIARSIAAFANNRGGRLLIGVKDNGTVAGIRNDEDIYVVESAAQLYCRPRVDVTFTAFKVEPGVIVIRASVPAVSGPMIHVVESDGQLKAYYRVNDENIIAHPVMVEARRDRKTKDTFISHRSHYADLLSMIDSEGELTLEQFARQSHLPTSTAIVTAASMLRTGSIALKYQGHQWVMTLPEQI